MSPPSVEEVGMGAPSGVVIAPASPPRPTHAGPSKKKFPDRVIVSMYVPPLERVHPSPNIEAPNLEDVLNIGCHRNPLNQKESSVMCMHDLYPNYFRMLVTARSEQYSISLPVYVDKEDIQPMLEDGMFILNHNFQRLAELVSVESKHRTFGFV